MQNRKKKKTQIYRTVCWTLWEKARVGCFKRTALKHVYYLGWNGSPAQVGCMRQVLGPGAMGKPRGSGWGGRCEGGSGWGTHVNPWLFHFNVWQNPLQIKIKKKNNTHLFSPMHQDPRHGLNGSCESFAVKVLSELNALNSLNAQLGQSSPPSSLMSLAEFLCGYRIHGSLLPQCQQ